MLLLIFTLSLTIGILFLYLSPQFGGKHTNQRLQEFGKSTNYQDGKFHNLINTPMDFPITKVIGEMLKPHPNRSPVGPVPVVKLNKSYFNESTGPRLTWFGHSAFLLELNEKRILLDPMFGISPAPHPLIGPKRYSKELPLEIDQMPYIDAVLLSHDHYDHLDYGSIKQLKEKVGMFYAPLGVGTHLLAWGIQPEKIKELDWWEETSLDDLRFVCTPARHFSGRALTDRFKTLWSSWVILEDSLQIYFSGDSGYGPHFKDIGERYGPFDIAMMECGQYNENWSSIHMMPEETVQAALDLDSELLMPIHWGAFSLAFHSWTDPVERALKAAKMTGLSITTPKIGEAILIDTPDFPEDHWWQSME